MKKIKKWYHKKKNGRKRNIDLYCFLKGGNGDRKFLM